MAFSVLLIKIFLFFKTVKSKRFWELKYFGEVCLIGK